MAENALQSLLLTVILLTSLAVISAAVACWQAFRSTRLTNSLRAQLQTPTSAARLETLAAEQAEFASSLQKITTTVKRLSSRYGMAELRERRADEEPPPVGAPKAQLRMFYGKKLGQSIGPEPRPVNFDRATED